MGVCQDIFGLDSPSVSTWFFRTMWSHLIAITSAGEVLAQIIGGRQPFEQLFSVLDPTISFPKAARETVSDTMLYLYCFGVPAVTVLVVNLAFGPGKITRRLSLVNWSLLGLGKSFKAVDLRL
jgi:hypothetical protein